MPTSSARQPTRCRRLSHPPRSRSPSMVARPDRHEPGTRSDDRTPGRLDARRAPAVGLAGRDPGRLPDRRPPGRPDRGWSRYRGGGARRRPDRGRHHRHSGMVRAQALGSGSLDRSDERRHGSRPDGRRRARRLRDRPGRHRPHGRCHRSRGRRVAGARTRTPGHQGRALVGSRDPSGLGARLARHVVRDLDQRRGAVHELRGGRGARLRPSHVGRPRAAVPGPGARARLTPSGSGIGVERAKGRLLERMLLVAELLTRRGHAEPEVVLELLDGQPPAAAL